MIVGYYCTVCMQRVKVDLTVTRGDIAVFCDTCINHEGNPAALKSVFPLTSQVGTMQEVLQEAAQYLAQVGDSMLDGTERGNGCGDLIRKLYRVLLMEDGTVPTNEIESAVEALITLDA